MNRKQLTVAAFILSLVVVFNCYAEDPIWQESQGVSVKLGVRDKFGYSGSYKALFVVVVKDKEGKEYTEYMYISPLRRVDGTITNYVAAK